MSAAFDPEAAARALLAVHRGAPRLPGLTPPPPDTAAAYAVQRAVIRALGGGAWKMALLAGRNRHAGAPADFPASRASSRRRERCRGRGAHRLRHQALSACATEDGDSDAASPRNPTSRALTDR